MPRSTGAEVQTRRQELLRIAAELFAERGYKATTVRDIADAAGILSGSLYHHFDSKESMVHELLDSFQTELFERYDAVVASQGSPREKLEDIVRLSFEAVGSHRAEVAIF
ncbi:MAG TPA: TetR/AcrR family transcriptional regulator, partial [Marmoricola sp.]|nr:TetR/AcrR family transcriptional regulator [Marmoricola sp.]